MGFRLEVVRRPAVPRLTRSERRSWQLHRRLSTLLNHLSFQEWRQLIDRGDLPCPHRVLTGLDRDSIEMREVSPWAAC